MLFRRSAIYGGDHISLKVKILSVLLLLLFKCLVKAAKKESKPHHAKSAMRVVARADVEMRREANQSHQERTSERLSNHNKLLPHPHPHRYHPSCPHHLRRRPRRPSIRWTRGQTIPVSDPSHP